MSYTTSVPVLRLAFSDGFRYYGDTTALTVSATVNLPVANVTHRKTGESLADGQLVPAQDIADFTVPDPWANGWAAPDNSHIVGWSYDVSMTVTATGQPPLLWTTTVSPRNNPETITPGMGRVTGGNTGDGSVDLTGYATTAYVDQATPYRENPFSHEQIVAAYLQRRGGVIGTGGLPAVALRVDHGAGNFRNIVLPHLKRLGIPAGIALNPGRLDIAENGGATWADYNNWATTSGVEPWNHGMTHGPASTLAEYDYEIRQARDLLQQNMPQSAIEGWLVPGVGDGGYEGQTGTTGPEHFYGYEAGRIIMETHAVSSGHMPGSYRPLNGVLQSGQAHYGMDSTTDAASYISVIQGAQAAGAGLQMFLHPSVINTAGRITEAVLVEILEYVAAERDAGRLVVLTPSGLTLGDSSTDRRLNLLPNGDFQDGFTGWTGTGWTVNTGATTTATGSSALSSAIRTGHQVWASGAVYEFVARVNAPGGATIECPETGSTATAPAVTGWQEVRCFATFPYGGRAHHTFRITPTTGSVEVADCRVQPV